MRPVRDIAYAIVRRHGKIGSVDWCKAQTAIEAALAEDRRATLEEAARVAETSLEPEHPAHFDGCCGLPIAVAIRGLVPGTGK